MKFYFLHDHSYDLKKQMDDRRVTVKILADKLGVSRQYIYSVLQENARVSYGKAQEIIEAVESFKK